MWKRLPELPDDVVSEMRRMKKIKLYADEDIEPEVIKYFKDNRVNITSAKTLGHQGKPDSFQTQFAYKDGRFILTKNAKDFLNHRRVPFNSINGVIAIEGTMANTDAYYRMIDFILDFIIPYADFYHKRKFLIADGEATIYGIINGQLNKTRMKYEEDTWELYQWVEK